MHQHATHSGQCSCCSMSRRCFLAASAVGLSAPLVAAASRERTSDAALTEHVDLAGLRPRPAVRILGAVVRHKPPYWLGWPGTSYDLEGHRETFGQAFVDAAARVGVGFEMADPPLEND